MKNLLILYNEIRHLSSCVNALDYLITEKPTRNKLFEAYPTCAGEIVGRLEEKKAIYFATKQHTTINENILNTIRKEYALRRNGNLGLFIVKAVCYLFGVYIAGTVAYNLVLKNILINITNNINL